MTHGLHRKPPSVKETHARVEKNRGKEGPGSRYFSFLCMRDGSNGLSDAGEASCMENSVPHTLPRTLPANSEQGRDVEVSVSQATQLFNSLKCIIIEIILSTFE